ncbi:Crp/Fnr family transcriptional regulator [Advenella mimigardefordensis]|uniref:Cyclic nucleotide-binding domain-containing protein n=1 Tax=Advenella mimigardefordensis (strain DSM 17166 / LMG 22922 / DPN7) TaxID=1247726 RepID=W0PAH6_ADVMD|nr:Crp/Fnr family transcriptional regulator [Advenella mimigardefordensis]AHG63701.1 cyclic nucleotide-binding domain-containing protein [Advenella mimigardefordensis DPN7]
MVRGRLSVCEFLARLPMFEGLSPAAVKTIALSVTHRSFHKGALIHDVIEKGATRQGFHIVVNGGVKLLFVAPNGGEKVVRTLGPGDSFGEESVFLEDMESLVSAQATSSLFLLHISKDSMLVLLEREPAFAMRMLSNMSRRVYALLKDIESYTLKSATQRVVDYFLEHAKLHEGGQFRFNTNKALVASLLNITPEHFSRIMRELCARNLISVEGRDVYIPDPARLQTYETADSE